MPDFTIAVPKYYTKESLCFFNTQDETLLISSEEGTRIGCKLSSFGFALTVQDTYEDVARYLRQFRDGSCIKAATDDVVVFIKNNPGQEAELFAKVIKVLEIVNKKAGTVGLSFANDKAHLLLPKDSALTDLNLLSAGVAVRSNMLPDPALHGLEVVGAPVGSVEFCVSFLRTTLDDMVAHAEALADLHPQCATKLLRDCVCPAPAYIVQVCHPNLTRELLSHFDERTGMLWLRILGDVPGFELKSCPDVLSRSRLRAFLPCRLDGAGLRSWQRASAYAWFCSFASCLALSDPDLEFARRTLGKDEHDAYELTMEALGGPSGGVGSSWGTDVKTINFL